MIARGEVIIDWIDAAFGNPLAVVARSAVLALGGIATEQISNPLRKAAVRVFFAFYLQRYFQLRPGGHEQYRSWLPVVTAARLSENIPELESWLVARVDAGLTQQV